eukprot:TRINITY_DN16680_c0_g1_i1.p1 TRINITY_DN16680_c0_g1~~TRINITY_DN16680_c0_g1_i1.p1  ORF type:complete len:473 (+),score=96.41 TRINITY_DN16680_c0_g1_i1:437-1855(+)
MYQNCLVVLLFVGFASARWCLSDAVNIADSVIKSDAFSHTTWLVNVSYVNEDNKIVSLYSHLSETFGIPASNNKVLTTSAAFSVFGPDFTTKTTVSLIQPDTLCLAAAGDASLTHDKLADLAKQVKNLGKQNFNLIVDDSLFGEEDVPDWEWSDMWYDYGAPPTPSVLEHNTISLVVSPGASVGSAAVIGYVFPQDAGTVEINNRIVVGPASSSPSISFSYRLREAATLVLEGSIPAGSQPIALDPIAVHLPARRLGGAFAAHLADQGITVYNISTTINPLCSVKGSQQVASVTSDPLSTLMNHTLQTSDNLEAEIWMRLLAVHLPTAGMSNYDSGKEAVRNVLSGLGVDITRFHQVDGSGLGSSNLVQPDAEVDVFFRMLTEKQYISFLPIGGVSGTLENRFIGTSAEGRVHAKTGSLTNVASLSGYLFSKNFPHPILISFIVNGSQGVLSANVRAAIDKIVVAFSDMVLC